MAARTRKAHGKHAAFNGRLVIVGFGSIGQGVLPLILRHVALKPDQITVIAPEYRGGADELRRYGVKFVRKGLTRDNHVARWK